MNKFAIAALAGCLCASVSAQESATTVTANPAFNSWVSTASQALTYSLDRVDLDRSETGISYVRFTCDENGKPSNITSMTGSSYRPNLARAARQAVHNIPTLHPMFRGAEPGQVYEAAILVAGDQAQLRELTEVAIRDARQKNARWASRDASGAVIALAAVAAF